MFFLTDKRAVTGKSSENHMTLIGHISKFHDKKLRKFVVSGNITLSYIGFIK